MKRFLLIVAAVALLAGCDLVPSMNPIIGTWSGNVLGPVTWTFDSTPRYTVASGSVVISEGKWSTSNGKLTRISDAGVTIENTYSISSDNKTLTISSSGVGFALVLTRQ